MRGLAATGKHEVSDLLKTIIAFDAARIVVLGDVMLDRYVFGEVVRISPEAAAPVFAIAGEDSRPGGAGNVARNIASLGGRAHLVGVIGRDIAGDVVEALVAAASRVDATLVRDPDRPTTVKTRFVADGQQLFRTDEESRVDISAPIADALLEALRNALNSADGLVCSDYAKGVLSTSVLQRAISLARSLGKFVVVDPKSRDMSRYSGATIVTPNAREAMAATGLDCADDEGVSSAARAISASSAGATVVVTRGSQGMTVFEHRGEEEKISHLATVSREVHDVTGAGDTVVATLALATAAGAPIEIAARLANAAASVAVSTRGATAVAASQLIALVQRAADADFAAKIVSPAMASKITDAWRRERQRIVFTNGCFDLLHGGHLALLRFARRQGDKLVVAINADESVKRLKGPGRPVQAETERASLLAALGAVDLVTIFSEDTPMKTIEALSPDVLVKGADYREEDVAGGAFVRSRGGRVALAPLEEGFSTTSVLRRISRRDASS